MANQDNSPSKNRSKPKINFTTKLINILKENPLNGKRLLAIYKKKLGKDVNAFALSDIKDICYVLRRNDLLTMKRDPTEPLTDEQKELDAAEIFSFNSLYAKKLKKYFPDIKHKEVLTFIKNLSLDDIDKLISVLKIPKKVYKKDTSNIRDNIRHYIYDNSQKYLQQIFFDIENCRKFSKKKILDKLFKFGLLKYESKDIALSPIKSSEQQRTKRDKKVKFAEEIEKIAPPFLLKKYKQKTAISKLRKKQVEQIPKSASLVSNVTSSVNVAIPKESSNTQSKLPQNKLVEPQTSTLIIPKKPKGRKPKKEILSENVPEEISKCLEAKTPKCKESYCDLITGKCVSIKKSGKPWNENKYIGQYNEQYKIIGPEGLRQKYINFIKEYIEKAKSPSKKKEIVEQTDISKKKIKETKDILEEEEETKIELPLRPEITKIETCIQKRKCKKDEVCSAVNGQCVKNHFAYPFQLKILSKDKKEFVIVGNQKSLVSLQKKLGGKIERNTPKIEKKITEIPKEEPQIIAKRGKGRPKKSIIEKKTPGRKKIATGEKTIETASFLIQGRPSRVEKYYLSISNLINKH